MASLGFLSRGLSLILFLCTLSFLNIASAIDFEAKYTMCFAGVTSKTLLMPTWGYSTFQSTKRFVTTIGKSQGRIVILGSGWAGFKLLRDINKNDYDVVVISPRNYFVFTPLLASTSVGTLEFRCIMEPVRSYSQDIEYYQAWCDSVDLEARTIECTSNLDDKKKKFTLSYDKLVISVGAYSNTFGIPGVKEYAMFLKDIADARKIRARVLQCFEHASQPNMTEKEQMALLHFAVVGGGPTGIEFSSELYDFISEDLSRLYPSLMDKVQMTVYDVAPQILGSFDQKLSEYATKRFRRKGIQIKTGKHVQEVSKDHLKVLEDGEVPYGMLVWATGLMQNPLVKSLEAVAKEPRSHRILTDDRLRILDKASMQPIEDVFALGDCATIKDYDLPATAQVANQKARYLGKALNKITHQGPNAQIGEFSFRNRGTMAYIGSWEAVVDMSSVHKQAKEQGHLAWFFWRSAYLSMSVSLRNKTLIPMYWFLTWLVGRDITQF